MKKLLFGAIAASLVMGITSCNPSPVVYRDSAPVVYAGSGTTVVDPVVDDVPANQYEDYTIIVDPATGAKYAVVNNGTSQYVLGYDRFMNWYNLGGIAYVIGQYQYHRDYFNPYSASRYRSWRNSVWHGSYNYTHTPSYLTKAQSRAQNRVVTGATDRSRTIIKAQDGTLNRTTVITKGTNTLGASTGVVSRTFGQSRTVGTTQTVGSKVISQGTSTKIMTSPPSKVSTFGTSSGSPGSSIFGKSSTKTKIVSGRRY